jgi:murein DD-endopeptidase MepM/ murein hydrolase activator NlpD
MEVILHLRGPISMKNFTYLLILVSFFGVSCGSAVPHIFSKKTPHEKYEDKLKDTGAANSPEGRMWLAASVKAVNAAQAISVPYKLKGFFNSDKPRALGLSFTAKQGELVVFDLQKTEGLSMYADLFKINGTEPTHILSAETGALQFGLEVKETGTYVLRLQPEINAEGQYELAVQAGPSLGFPVSGSKARVGSVWGDSRDGGKRSHEGIDIFAPKRTPVVAIADGYISAVRDGGLGGKTVNLRPTGSNYSLYYAHLDEQHVKEGQFVKKGEVLGLVGNTGNAKTTPPHLHFGIYSYGGAIDPLPFVNKVSKTPASIPQKELAGNTLRLVKSHKTADGQTLKINSILTPLAITPKGYLAEDELGNLHLAPFSSVKAVRTEPRTITARKGADSKTL